jgi:hypothetical protein
LSPLAVRTKRPFGLNDTRTTGAPVPEDMELPSGVDPPEPRCVVVACRGDELPVGAEGDSLDGAGVPKDMECSAVGHVPDPRRGVGTPRHDEPPLAAERDCVDRAAVQKNVELSARGHAQIPTVESALPLATSLPSGLNAAARTAPP